MSFEYFIEDEFYERVESYRIATIGKHYNPPFPAHLVLDGIDYQIFSSDIYSARDLTYEQIAWFIKISCFDCCSEFGDLVDWHDKPENRHPQLLEHHRIEKLLIDMEQKGYITLYANG